MHLREGAFEQAHVDFFEAFKNYDESGNARRTTCLKYLVLASMLMKSDINPFDSQEAKPYKSDPEILAMTELVSAYQNNDIAEFERILRENKDAIMEDPFIREHIEGAYGLRGRCQATPLQNYYAMYGRKYLSNSSNRIHECG